MSFDDFLHSKTAIFVIQKKYGTDGRIFGRPAGRTDMALFRLNIVGRNWLRSISRRFLWKFNGRSLWKGLSVRTSVTHELIKNQEWYFGTDFEQKCVWDRYKSRSSERISGLNHVRLTCNRTRVCVKFFSFIINTRQTIWKQKNEIGGSQKNKIIFLGFNVLLGTMW